MEQRCHLSMVWLTWVGLPLLAVVVGIRTGLVAGRALGVAGGFGIGLAAGLVVLGVGVAAQVFYMRWFPHLSSLIGYGSVADTPAPPLPAPARLPDVTLYTANVCPFCPIVKRRLAELQRQNPFEIEEVDVTFRPEVIRAKGLRSVPVLEANGRLLVGNATTAQIVEFLKAGAQPHDATA